MSEQDRYIPGVPCWVDTSQPDPAAAAEFYAGLFGWDVEDTMPPDSPRPYLIGRIGGGDVAALTSPPEGAPPVAVWNTYVRVASADAAAQRVRDAGGSVLMEPGDAGDFGRMAIFADPEGAVFRVWEAKEHTGATVVNEHGALNFNTLASRDPEAAAAFYGAVFGWELLSFGDAGWWVLPAYGDFLEQRTPGMRERMAEMGAPPRFEEVVAAVNPIASDQADVPAHWGVTFAVDDADAAAARAVELGGRVLMEPMDLPWVRMAVIADPAGATFTASQFVPENKDLGQQQAGVTASGRG